jgi:hypothetical protein
MTDELMTGYERAKTQFYAPSHIFKRLMMSRTGLWWTIPRNLGYLLGFTGEVRARAATHQERSRQRDGSESQASWHAEKVNQNP